MWSEIEVAALLICSCIPSFRMAMQRTPYLNRVFGYPSNEEEENQFKPGDGTRKGSIPLNGYGRPDYYLQSSQQPKTHRHNPSQFGMQTHAIGRRAARNESTEEIFPHKTDGNGAILVTREFAHAIEYDDNMAMMARSNSSGADSMKSPKRVDSVDKK